MDSGKPLLHYSPDTEIEDRDGAILTSGFFSAISSFLQESRSSKVDSFTSKSEVFVFSHIDQFDLEVVGVFDKDIKSNLATEFLENIKLELMKTGFVREENRNRLDEEKQEFKKRIPDIQGAILQGHNQIDHVEELVTNRPEIMLGLMYDHSSDEKLWHSANPSSLYSSQFLEQVKLLHQVISNLITKIYGTDSYRQVSISTSRYMLTAFVNGDILYLLMGHVDAKLDKFIPELAHLSALEISSQDQIKTILSESKIDKLPDGYPPLTPVLFSTVLNNINTIVSKTIKRRAYDTITIVFESAERYKEIQITNHDETELVLPVNN